MKHIKTWSERCEEHPDHQWRIISERMIQERMQEEIDELRQALETEREWVGLTDEEIQDLSFSSEKFDASHSEWFDRWGFARAVEAKLKERNT